MMITTFLNIIASYFVKLCQLREKVTTLNKIKQNKLSNIAIMILCT